MRNRLFFTHVQSDIVYSEDEKNISRMNLEDKASMLQARQRQIEDGSLKTRLLSMAADEQKDGGNIKSKRPPLQKRLTSGITFSKMGWMKKKGRSTGLYFDRYFVLRNGKLFSFPDEDSHRQACSGEIPYPDGLSLQGYEVMVDTRDRQTIALCSMDSSSSRTTKTLFCESEEEMVEWIQALIAASTIAQ